MPPNNFAQVSQTRISAHLHVQSRPASHPCRLATFEEAEEALGALLAREAATAASQAPQATVADAVGGAPAAAAGSADGGDTPRRHPARSTQDDDDDEGNSGGEGVGGDAGDGDGNDEDLEGLGEDDVVVHDEWVRVQEEEVDEVFEKEMAALLPPAVRSHLPAHLALRAHGCFGTQGQAVVRASSRANQSRLHRVCASSPTLRSNMQHHCGASCRWCRGGI